MKLPNAIIVGASKAGTTSLSYYLNQHSEVFWKTDDEPDFFSKRLNNGLSSYAKLFKDRHELVVGESSPSYLNNPEVPQRILNLLGPEVKIIISVRNPIERAFSDYLMAINNAVEDRTFIETLTDNAEQLKEFEAGQLGYSDFEWKREFLQIGHYTEHIKRYQAVFGKSQVHIVNFHSLGKDALGTVNEIFDFLGLPPMQALSLKRHNTYNTSLRKYKSMLGNELFVKLKKAVPYNMRHAIKVSMARSKGDKPRMQPDDRQWLLDYYREEITRLNSLVAFDTLAWLKQPQKTANKRQ